MSRRFGETRCLHLHCQAVYKVQYSEDLEIHQRRWAILRSTNRKYLHVPPPTRYLPRPSRRCRCHAFYPLRHRAMTYPALTHRPKWKLLRHTEMIYPAPTESRTRTPLHDTEALLPGSHTRDKTRQNLPCLSPTYAVGSLSFKSAFQNGQNGQV